LGLVIDGALSPDDKAGATEVARQFLEDEQGTNETKPNE